MRKNNVTQTTFSRIGKLSATFAVFSTLMTCGANAQSLKDMIRNKNGKDTSTQQAGSGNLLKQLNKKLGGNAQSLSATDIASGLKEALIQGINKGAAQLAAPDGFLGNAAIKILMPPEAQKAEETLRKLGLGKEVDQAITSMNRAAEDAAKSAAPIFLEAIKAMSIQDAAAILGGKENAATEYLKQQTTASLTKAFSPVIDNSLEKVNATKHWNTVFTQYNRFATQKVNPNLSGYVTEKALEGLFKTIAIEEANIRKDPAARTSEILKKVFAN